MNSKSIYKRIYDNLVESHKGLREEWKPVGSGLERHHIVPRHAGGLDEESNYTYLTHREHIIAHWLLWKLNKCTEDKLAWQSMFAKDISIEYHSERTKSKISEGLKGNTNKRGKSPSEETRRKLSIAGKGRIVSEETRRKLRVANLGKKLSEETRRKISKARRAMTKK